MPTAAEPASSPLLPTSPTAAEWRAMTPTQRERLLVAINEALSDPLVAMTEGRRHQTTKTRTLDTLGLHFAALGRQHPHRRRPGRSTGWRPGGRGRGQLAFV